MECRIKKTKRTGTQKRSWTPMERKTLYLLIRKSQGARAIYQIIRIGKKKRRDNQLGKTKINSGVWITIRWIFT